MLLYKKKILKMDASEKQKKMLRINADKHFEYEIGFKCYMCAVLVSRYGT